MRYRFVLAGSACACTLLLGVIFVARAAGDERTRAQAIVAELDRDVAHRALVAEPVGRAKAALDRGAKLRGSGDESHARIADGVAAEWAELARDVVRTADYEQRAADVRRAANDAGARAERERALLEEGIAQNGRLRAELDAIEREGKNTDVKHDKTSKLGATSDGGAASASDAGGKPRTGGSTSRTVRDPASGGSSQSGSDVRDGGGP